MTYKQITKFNYETLCYNQFLYTCALYKRRPFKVLQYESEGDSTKLIIFSRTQTDTVTTRHMKFSNDSACVIVAQLLRDFGDIEVEILNDVN